MKNDWEKDFEEFDEEKKSNSSGGNSENPVEWMKFTKAAKYKVRLVGNYVKYHQFWNPFGKGVIVDPDDRNKTSAVKAGFYPSTRFAILILDKNDLDENGVAKPKVLDKGPSVFKEFHNYFSVNEVNPAGAEGPDFIINVKNPGTLKAEYSVTAVAKPSPLSKEEVQKIRDVKENWPSLDVLKKAVPLEEIEKMWDALPDEKKVKEKASSKESIATETTVGESQEDDAIDEMEEEDIF